MPSGGATWSNRHTTAPPPPPPRQLIWRLSAAIGAQQAFSDTALSLIQVGEESGELPTMLKSLAALYEDTSRQRMKQFLLFLEPCAILLIGIVVGGIVAAIMLAITSVNQVAL